ncbi:MAG: Stealth CR1 domain-containing protein [Firmicutes bacterium]|nr:Stealth CR1 domain-containing protein [Bacillota bacterium]
MDIDLVVLWVDGSDPAWLAEKRRYQSDVVDDSNAPNRFRDWGLMPYWFRAVEQFTPWVRKIHFVTWGHVPSWLDLDHPKLHHVKHTDFIPGEYLPTFSANTIEMNIHRIPDLAEHFVYFNDDMFILRPMEETDFFREGLPCSFGAEVPLQFSGAPGIWQHLIINDIRTVNDHFRKPIQVRQFRRKYLSRAYRWQDNLRTAVLEKLFPDAFLGFKNLHAPAAFRRQTFEEIWSAEAELLHRTCLCRFRSNDDVNQWLAVWWQLAAGSFSPYAVDNVVEDVTDATIDSLCRTIRLQRHDMVCVNDPSEGTDVKLLSEKLRAAFDTILPQKSSFEK